MSRFPFENKQLVENKQLAPTIDTLNDEERKTLLGEILRGFSIEEVKEIYEASEHNFQDNTAAANSLSYPNQSLMKEGDKQPATPEVESGIEKLREIDSSITNRGLTGKFKGPVHLHGEYVGDARNDGYYTYGKKSHSRSIRFNHLNQIYMTRVKENNIIAYETDLDDPSLSNMSVIYGHKYKDNATRPTYFMSVDVTLPAENLRELLEMVRENPNMLEEFYKVAADGLDSNDTIEPLRLRSEQLSIIDLDVFMPPENFTRPDGKIRYPATLREKGLDHSGVQQFEVPSLQ